MVAGYIVLFIILMIMSFVTVQSAPNKAIMQKA